MRTYERTGVQIEQCDQCYGIFLDYGELEHLNQIESVWTRSQQAYDQQEWRQGPAQPQHGHLQPQHGDGFGYALFQPGGRPA
jgi:Zn-finger nucleic acid-binding protein